MLCDLPIFVCFFVLDSKTKVIGVSKERSKAKQIVIKLLLVGKNEENVCKFVTYWKLAFWMKQEKARKKSQVLLWQNSLGIKIYALRYAMWKKTKSFGGKFFSVKDIAFLKGTEKSRKRIKSFSGKFSRIKIQRF